MSFDEIVTIEIETELSESGFLFIVRSHIKSVRMMMCTEMLCVCVCVWIHGTYTVHIHHTAPHNWIET